MNINIIYWSATGNTEQMAHLIAQGAIEAGAKANVKEVSAASQADVDSCDVLVLGCPSMGDEVLEEDEFEPFMQSIEGHLSGKPVALFGSYGWGDGEWMRNWTVRMQEAGVQLKVESLIVNEAPEDEAQEVCREFGRKSAL